MKNNIDSLIVFILIKKLVTPIVNTKAYKLKLVDKSGKVIKKQISNEEKNALTILDKFIFKLKRLLGSKITLLNKFLYLKTLNIDIYQKLLVRGNVEQRAEIIRINKDIENLQEKYKMSMEDLAMVMINESFKEENIDEI
jgi:hypothetical protein